MVMAGVLGRGEYLKAKTASYWTSCEKGDGLLEVGLGLAGEAYDNVGGHADRGVLPP